jgi:hypothetical protein
VYSATVSLLVGFRKMSRTAAGGHHAGRNRMQTSRAGTKLTRSNYHIRVEPFKWVETAC